MESVPLISEKEDLSLNQAKNKTPPLRDKGDLEGRSVSLLENVMKYTGIAALVSAFGSLILCRKESHTPSAKAGHCLGSCYVIAEAVLIVAVIGYVALQIFLKIR